MSVLTAVLWVGGAVIGLALIWGGLTLLFGRVFNADEPGFIAAAIVGGTMILSLIVLAVWDINNDDPNTDSGRCGPGTKQVVERIWTGKVYVTDYVCVVDLAG